MIQSNADLQGKMNLSLKIFNQVLDEAFPFQTFYCNECKLLELGLTLE